MKTKTIDARGLTCPLPVINAKKAAGEMGQEGVLTVLVDNEIAVQNLQKFAAQKGYTASGEKEAEKEYRVVIDVSGADSAPEISGTAAQDKSGVISAARNDENARSATVTGAAGCAPDMIRFGMVVVLSADMMGTGDDALGKTLMKSFVFALTKQDVLPETVLCYNRGAYLSCKGSESFEDLKALEAEGVSIMTCGTCLDYYGLKDELGVGSVTNMYEIVEVMEKAVTVIRP